MQSSLSIDQLTQQCAKLIEDAHAVAALTGAGWSKRLRRNMMKKLRDFNKTLKGKDITTALAGDLINN